MKYELPKYLIKIIHKFPNILSGRKNYKNHHKRINNSLKHQVNKNEKISVRS